ncbi:MAG: PEP-CTERM sorting domain-containing protein [Bryobacterales bacterium]|nr:PEP-CTERM sorting domain-containing protein [Bryobacterales bacterium]
MGTSLTAAPLTFNDAYAGQNPGDTKNNGDVIGYLRSFDIRSLSINSLGGGNVHVQILMNYGTNGGDTSLSGIVNGGFPVVHPGDVMISNGTNRWAIPLISHNNSMPSGAGLLAGNLYMVSDFLTAATVLNNTNAGSYRPDHFVWGNATGATQKSSNGTVAATSVGGAEIRVDINFTTNDNLFLSTLSEAGTMFSFAAATCANDVVDGSNVPEPASFALIGAGLIAVGLRKRLVR